MTEKRDSFRFAQMYPEKVGNQKGQNVTVKHIPTPPRKSCLCLSFLSHFSKASEDPLHLILSWLGFAMFLSCSLGLIFFSKTLVSSFLVYCVIYVSKQMQRTSFWLEIMPTAFCYRRGIHFAATCKKKPNIIVKVNRVLYLAQRSTSMRNAVMKDAVRKKWMRTPIPKATVARWLYVPTYTITTLYHTFSLFNLLAILIRN